MKKFTYDVILARLSERENKTKSEETSAGDKKRRAFLDLLLDEYENGNITIDGIREEVDTFMFEGHDTTAAAINFAFYHIAKDSRIKENLQREVDEVFRGDMTRDVTTEDLGKLDYVDAFIREILRLYPSVQRVQSSRLFKTETSYFVKHVFMFFPFKLTESQSQNDKIDHFRTCSIHVPEKSF